MDITLFENYQKYIILKDRTNFWFIIQFWTFPFFCVAVINGTCVVQSPKGSDPPGCQLDIVHYVYEELMLGQYWKKNDRNSQRAAVTKVKPRGWAERWTSAAYEAFGAGVFWTNTHMRRSRSIMGLALTTVKL